MSDSTIRIKRYPNRRYYDTNESKYIALKDIEEMVRSGSTVEIVESQSGEDMTRAVLTQIILDRQPEKMRLFPVDMLHSIVRSNDVVAGFLRDYFQHSLTYINYLQQHGSGARGMANPMHWVKAWLEGVKPSGEPAPAGDDQEPSTLVQKIEQLENRIRQLESKDE